MSYDLTGRNTPVAYERGIPENPEKSKGVFKHFVIMNRNIGLLFFTLLFVATACSKETVIPQEKAPAAIREYLDKHFPGQAILQVVKDRDGLELSYDVTIEGPVKLEFSKKYEVTSIEGTAQLPDSVIPAKILDFVNEKYPGSYIKSWDLDDKRHEIELQNGLELVFNANGDFLRIDS